jgi:hypothetical protein
MGPDEHLETRGPDSAVTLVPVRKDNQLLWSAHNLCHLYRLKHREIFLKRREIFVLATDSDMCHNATVFPPASLYIAGIQNAYRSTGWETECNLIAYLA